MKSFFVGNLKPGDYFTEDVFTDSNQLIHRRSVILTQIEIRKLKEWKINEIYSNGEIKQKAVYSEKEIDIKLKKLYNIYKELENNNLDKIKIKDLCNLSGTIFFEHFSEMTEIQRNYTAKFFYKFNTNFTENLRFKLLSKKADRNSLILWLEICQRTVKENDVSILNILIKFLVHNDEYVRATAIRVIGNISGKKYYSLIKSRLYDLDFRVIANVIEYFEFFGSEDDWEIIDKCFDMPDKRIKINVIKALFKLNPEAGKKRLDCLIKIGDYFSDISLDWLEKQLKIG